MKTRTRRLLSLLLALLMVLSLAPAAEMAEGDDEDTGEETTVTAFSLVDDGLGQLDGGGQDYKITLEPDATNTGGIRVLTKLEPDNAATRQKIIKWESSDTAVATISQQSLDGYGEGHAVSIIGRSPGKATITASVDGLTCSIAVEVSGIKLSDELLAGLMLMENEIYTLTKEKDYFLYGNAAGTDVSITATEVNGKNIVYIPSTAGTGTNTVTIEGRAEGTGMIRLHLSGSGHTYEAEFPVTVASNLQTIEWTKGCSPATPLKFSDLEDEIAKVCTEAIGGTLTSIIGLTVSTDQGILYLNYKSPDDPGAGVGGSVTYNVRSALRGPYISDITFVPNSAYKGETATINFTGNASNGRSFKGRIIVTLTDTESELVVTTKRDTPVKLEYTAFSKICQEQTGTQLDYVIFTLPSAAEGTLYRDYKDEWNYASKVSASSKYAKRDIDDITFVPANGFVGEVRVSYSGYSVSGTKYTGELVIQVKQGLDDAISYNDGGGGVIDFKRSDFDAFCANATGTAISSISFVPPSASQGKLYLNWNGVRGTEITDGASYSPTQIDRITFVAADGFEGVVRIAFSGTSRGGETFTGTAELHIQSSGTGSGDINYICAAGQSVKLAVSDFTALCQALTGQKLHYITFQTLPDFSQGALYHNRTSAGGMGTRVNTATKYFNSATPYIMNLSFWATEQFSYVEIPFTGATVSGQTFTAILAISSGAGAGSGSFGTVNYSTIGQNPVQFVTKDFDDACRQATNNALAYLRFDLPGSGQGILYYDYRSDTNPTALDTSKTLYPSGDVSIDKVAFVPARGFSGTVSIPFTGWAINGREFRGTVQISVQAANAMGGVVYYETQGEPVRFKAADIQAAAGSVPTSLRLTGLPPASQGKIYYQYEGPILYSWEGNTTTTYTLSGDPSVSNLAFVPKAGFYGTVTIPYAATNANGTQSNGTIQITVVEPYNSSFTDLSGYTYQTKSAIEYLASMGVVIGIGNGKYDPSASIRRRDFCVMLTRAFQFTVGSTTKEFSDVPSDSYYAAAIGQMYSLGVVNGIGGGKFDPNSPITRQDAAVMVQRALDLAGIGVAAGSSEVLAGYGDGGQVKDYAQSAVSGMIQAGIFPITSNKNIAPRTSLTRADMALLLHRAMTQ